MALFDIKVHRIYIRKKGFSPVRITYDKTSKGRPAWIKATGIPKSTGFLLTLVNGRRVIYRFWISPKYDIFLPADYTKDELKKFYDEFSKIYDVRIVKNNAPATRFLAQKIKAPKTANVLDLGAGTGISSEVLIKAGYKNLTLLDYSAGMLAKAKKKPLLKNCRFVKASIRDMNFKENFDLITSVYSFAESGYFEEEEMPALWKKVAAQMNKGAVLALFGYYYKPPSKLFKKLKSGIYMLKKKWPAKWYVGVKR